ncbi:MAG: hypothetical protein U0V49_07345 [Saprospiraceae bacterium]
MNYIYNLKLNVMDAQRHVLIMGASGMIGSLVLEECLNSNKIGRVTTIGRKKLPEHPKLTQIISENVSEPMNLLKGVDMVDVCYYCIGVYTGQVPKDEFIKITVDMPVAFARALYASSPQCHFVLLSGDGADRSGKSSLLFARQKGIAENELLKIGFPHVYCCRPGYIYPDAVRKEPNTAYAVIKKLYPLVSFFYPSFGIRSGQLARAMFNIGLQNIAQNVFTHQDLLRQAKLQE